MMSECTHTLTTPRGQQDIASRSSKGIYGGAVLWPCPDLMTHWILWAAVVSLTSFIGAGNISVFISTTS